MNGERFEFEVNRAGIIELRYYQSLTARAQYATNSGGWGYDQESFLKPRDESQLALFKNGCSEFSGENLREENERLREELKRAEAAIERCISMGLEVTR